MLPAHFLMRFAEAVEQTGQVEEELPLLAEALVAIEESGYRHRATRVIGIGSIW